MNVCMVVAEEQIEGTIASGSRRDVAGGEWVSLKKGNGRKEHNTAGGDPQRKSRSWMKRVEANKGLPSNATECLGKN